MQEVPLVDEGAECGEGEEWAEGGMSDVVMVDQGMA